MSKWLTPGVLKQLEETKKMLNTRQFRHYNNRKDFDDARLADEILFLRNHRIVDWEDTFVYTSRSKFVFGKFKDNELRHVWKVAPDYVEWCLINADGFIIDPNDLEKILLEPVIEYEYLLTLVDEDSARFTINLTSLPLNANGFRVAPYEEVYEISESAINANRIKLTKECHPGIVHKGSSWDEDKAVIRIPRRTSIVIKG